MCLVVLTDVAFGGVPGSICLKKASGLNDYVLKRVVAGVARPVTRAWTCHQSALKFTAKFNQHLGLRYYTIILRM